MSQKSGDKTAEGESLKPGQGTEGRVLQVQDKASLKYPLFLHGFAGAAASFWKALPLYLSPKTHLPTWAQLLPPTHLL